MRKLILLPAALMMLASLPTIRSASASPDTYHWTMPKPGQPICNSAFPGSLKVCHPVGTSPAGVIHLSNTLQLVTLAPFSTWEGLTAKAHPKIAVFRGKQITGLLSGKNVLPFFQNISTVAITDLSNGGYMVRINAWDGGNSAHSNETLVLRVTATGRLALQSAPHSLR